MPAAKDTVQSSAPKTTLAPTSETKVTGGNAIKKSTQPKASRKSTSATPDRIPKRRVLREPPPYRDPQAQSTKKRPPAVDNSKQATPSPEERYRMIAVAAYYRAEKRGFIDGNPAQDWMDAEAEVEQLISKHK